MYYYCFSDHFCSKDLFRYTPNEVVTFDQGKLFCCCWICFCFFDHCLFDLYCDLVGVRIFRITLLYKNSYHHISRPLSCRCLAIDLLAVMYFHGFLKALFCHPPWHCKCQMNFHLQSIFKLIHFEEISELGNCGWKVRFDICYWLRLWLNIFSRIGNFFVFSLFVDCDTCLVD